MMWSVILIKLKKVRAWIKKNWKLFAGMSIPVIVYLVSRKSFDMSEILDRVKSDYEKELDAIEKAHDSERKAREAAIKRYQSALADVERRYEESNQVLDSKKRKEVENVLSAFSDDPDEITRRIAEITGFDIHVSE